MVVRCFDAQDGQERFLLDLEGDDLRLVIELLGKPDVEVLQSDLYADAGAVAVSPMQGILPADAVQVLSNADPRLTSFAHSNTAVVIPTGR